MTGLLIDEIVGTVVQVSYLNTVFLLYFLFQIHSLIGLLLAPGFYTKLCAQRTFWQTFGFSDFCTMDGERQGFGIMTVC